MNVRVIQGDCREVLRALPDASVHCLVTSPPYYGLRDYGVVGQTGLEQTPDEYVGQLVDVFRAARRLLRDDGTFWLNLGDSYSAGNGTKTNGPQTNTTTVNGAVVRTERGVMPSDDRATLTRSFAGMPKLKDLLGIPWRVAFALQADGWWLRSAIIWHKPNPMPESCKDRPTSAYEMVFLFAKSDRYFYDAEAAMETAIYPGDNRAARRDLRKEIDPMCADKGSRARTGNPTGEYRNARNVWTIAPKPYKGSHFAVMPAPLAARCIKAGCPVGGTVLDPFGGAGTTGLVADRLGRDAILIELNPDYCEMARRRISGDAPLFAETL